MRPILGIAATFASAAGLVVAGAVPALAGGEHIALTCGSTTYDVVVNGNGDWTPARDSNSTLVFHPTAFGEFNGTFTPSDGSPAQHETDPPFERKNQPANGRETGECSYHISFSDESGTFEGDGTATGWTSGTRQS